jgi:predicted O-methyltransferase YrrM
LFHKITSFVGFLFKSRNKHSVHSPFVFNLITKCFHKKCTIADLNTFLNYKKELSLNTSILEVTDFGAGSRIFSSNKRKVSKIAKHVGISNKRARLLINIIQYFKPGSILEIGTSLGLSTAALASSNKNSKITTREGCKETSSIAKNMFEKYHFNNVKLLTGSFDTTLPKIFKNTIYDFIYFDGNHTRKATLEYFESSLSSINNNSVLLFDDIHWNKEMEQAWEEIKNHPQVTVTIDTYQWGFVFFRKEQEKEHFTIRI